MLPAYAKEKNIAYSNREGWLSGCFDKIVEENKKKEESNLQKEVDLVVCFPVSAKMGSFSDDIMGVKFYGFVEDLNTPENYKENLEDVFRDILDKEKPDMVHIFGTEFPHALAMARAFNNPSKVLLGIQGACKVIADEYMAMLPPLVQKDRSFRDILKKDSLLEQKEKYEKRAINEEEAIKLSGHIAGRTNFDRNFALTINPKAKYHVLNETMRDSFYDGRWTKEGANTHTIFMSQGDYPLKGFHFMLSAMPIILEKYPDAHLYVAGNSLIGAIDRSYVSSFEDGDNKVKAGRVPLFIKISAYGRYLKLLIAKNKLKERVTMLGPLSEKQMKEQFLKASVYVCPSVVENSPNSVCEAMLLGTPVVASRVCGIPSIIDDGKEGVLFEKGDEKELANAIMQVWEEKVITDIYSENARKRAEKVHDKNLNFARLLQIYHAIAGC